MLNISRGKLASLEKKRNQFQRKLDAIDAEIEMLGGSSRGGGRVHNARSLSETMVQVFTARGGPMKVSEIAEAAKAAGYRSKSANFRGIVNQTLIKDKQFVSHSRGTYQLKK
ncbi:MAG TPA: HTH domain-containing protein [Tepidisphaeraceae bacterium]|nr:HTH domain-containing protein [Tepidisphaeraceae bacterium]